MVKHAFRRFFTLKVYSLAQQRYAKGYPNPLVYRRKNQPNRGPLFFFFLVWCLLKHPKYCSTSVNSVTVLISPMISFQVYMVSADVPRLQ